MSLSDCFPRRSPSHCPKGYSPDDITGTPLPPSPILHLKAKIMSQTVLRIATMEVIYGRQARGLLDKLQYSLSKQA